MQPELVRRLSADLDGVAAALHRAGAKPDAAARLLELSAAAVVDAVALLSLRDPPHGLREPRRVHALHRQVEPNPPASAGVFFAKQAYRPPARVAL